MDCGIVGRVSVIDAKCRLHRFVQNTYLVLLHLRLQSGKKMLFQKQAHGGKCWSDPAHKTKIPPFFGAEGGAVRYVGIDHSKKWHIEAFSKLCGASHVILDEI
jgi:hypothetical protein